MCCSKEDIVACYGEEFLLKAAGDGEGNVDEGKVKRAISAAADLVDSHLDGAPDPGIEQKALLGLVRDHAVRIAAYRLALGAGISLVELGPEYQAAVNWLGQARDGQLPSQQPLAKAEGEVEGSPEDEAQGLDFEVEAELASDDEAE